MNISEGKMSKGGVNTCPTMQRPPAPKGQGSDFETAVALLRRLDRDARIMRYTSGFGYTCSDLGREVDSFLSRA